jgi:hypothetical protein
VEKERVWSRKIDHQTALKEDYEKQMWERGEKSKEEKAIDREYLKMQAVENDRFMERRMLDFMKIYDRRPVK